jgi:hypothetical protein
MIIRISSSLQIPLLASDMIRLSQTYFGSIQTNLVRFRKKWFGFSPFYSIQITFDSSVSQALSWRFRQISICLTTEEKASKTEVYLVRWRISSRCKRPRFPILVPFLRSWYAIAFNSRFYLRELLALLDGRFVAQKLLFLVPAKTRRWCEELFARRARSRLYIFGAEPLSLLGVFVATRLLCCACFVCSHHDCQMHISVRISDRLDKSNFMTMYCICSPMY